MFYVSSRKGKLIGITDTADGVEEMINMDKLTCYLARGVVFVGVKYKNMNSDPMVKPLGVNSVKLIKLPIGSPVRVKLKSNGDFKQYIVAGFTADGVTLYDGSMYNVKYDYIDIGGVLVDTEHNDAVAVTRLLQSMH